ncbi:uncharacterized protein LOC115625587 [Scaptodrosophila lebanonensis]|uniref:Uncharacterized protein LOC115625587 n=1 Tax=Drosophila lebanonensis TaxID=7225 RepID=A0A6J2TNJ9_DROLE|nr:uncharacterized protein LOC115625587 [Scaptodrosophila lebanonensis]XP_030376558.1 uncharacterized protein LOC115625587 [Scaptodrosophila lebanonensis]
MSCQQVSRFITTTATTATTASPGTRKITTTTLGQNAGASSATAASIKTTTLTPEDPYAFTETVSATPPILFNAQKSRARLNELQHIKTYYSSNNNNNTSTNNNNKPTLATTTSASSIATTVNTKQTIVANQKVATAPLAQLNGTATTTTTRNVATTAAAAAAVVSAKAQASLATVGPNNAITTNFSNVTQSQKQQSLQSQTPTQSQLQSQSQTKPSPQASPKRGTNVCVVRPQQQQQQQQQQVQLKLEKLAPILPPPPPLYTHTPSLWQTPLILDTGIGGAVAKQTTLLSPATNSNTNAPQLALVVSPPTSPASLPTSPTGTATVPPTAAVTAMVAPIVVPASPPKVAVAVGQPLPPSKFHHTTLAQHLQKVECLKKKKSSPLICTTNNNNNAFESLNKLPLAYNLTQPPPLTVFTSPAAAESLTAVATATLQRTKVTLTATHKHSANVAATAVADDSDLNEIPVNVIFRKPSVLVGNESCTEQAGSKLVNAPKSKNGKMRMPQTGKLGAVAHLTPGVPLTPPSQALLSNLLPQLPPVSTPSQSAAPTLASTAATSNTPALVAKAVHAQTHASPSLKLALPPPPTNMSNQHVEHMSSKVANAAAVVAAPIRKTNGDSGAGRRASKTVGAAAKKYAAQNVPALAKMLPTLPTQTQLQFQLEQIMPNATDLVAPAVTSRPQRTKQTNKMLITLATELEPEFNDLPYCIQTKWLHASKDLGAESLVSLSNRREERIAVRKSMLRRQALQLLSTRTLQESPVRAARKRLQCVQSLILKYKDHAAELNTTVNRCLVPSCPEISLTMAAHCERHIVNNATQQIFVPCMAKGVNGLTCQAPVFDVLHALALCPNHRHQRGVLEQQQSQPLLMQLPQPHASHTQGHASVGIRPSFKGQTATQSLITAGNRCSASTRKRKTNGTGNPVGRPQKRVKKQQQVHEPVEVLPTVLPPISAVLQRKSSTTSLESIASNSHSSGAAQLPFTSMPIIPQRNNHNILQNNGTQPQLSIPPALAPLSDQNGYSNVSKFEADQLDANNLLGGNVNLLANTNFKVDEISQIVAQLTAASGEVNHNNNNSHFNNNISYSSSNNNSGNRSSFPSFNTAFGGAVNVSHNISAMNTAVGGTGPMHHMANTESMLTQDMFGICENSSVYASSEDTGLGGLSESELIGANDADDMALNSAHLLEEHDLVNVFDTLPDDAFNELFQSVQEADCEAVDRALEIADKNLKCLQQTIGGSDSAFLNDLLDVGDDLLVNAVSSVMNSPNTSGIDASTLFVDSSGGGHSSNSNSASGAGGSISCTPATTTVADIRGLVQT